VKPELGKEVESDPDLADFIWNGSDALLPMDPTIERINMACLENIKSTFGGMCIKKLRDRMSECIEQSINVRMY
jgi:hypothetical protein